MSDAVYVFASFTPKPDAGGQVESLLRSMAVNSRGEPGCQVYNLFTAAGDPPTFHIFEQYADTAALEAHRATEHYRDYRARIPELLADDIGVVVLEPLDVDG